MPMCISGSGAHQSLYMYMYMPVYMYLPYLHES